MKYKILILFEIILVSLLTYNSRINDGNLLITSILFILVNIPIAIIVKRIGFK